MLLLHNVYNALETLYCLSVIDKREFFTATILSKIMVNIFYYKKKSNLYIGANTT